MIEVNDAIARMRRDLTLGSVLKGLMLGAAFFCLLLDAVARPKGFSGSVALAVIGGVWLVLSYRSVRGSRMAAVSPALIAQGNFEQAERHIDEALRAFSLFRTVKLRSLHHLAVLRHAQRRWVETVVLCQALLGQRLGALGGISRSTRLILADSLLNVGDLHRAHEALAGLYQQRLTLGEALELTVVQVDYLARVGAWEQMMQGVGQKVQLAEMLPTEASARVQALLGLGAKKMGKKELSEWLRKRAELLVDGEELVRARPVLGELWAA
ncbi:MAG TPA: hypothetical protein VGQ99_16830 [Tepidisphaeraceae bacterium]|jgi:hypothetical protein|nr:hypothetical protein [Tepidisphaeraceae bacterium]